MKVILVDQGRTAWDDEGRLQGTIDVPLSERGRKEVASLARKLKSLKPKRILSGTGETQRETSEILAKGLGCRVVRRPELNALDHGLWQGMRHAELLARCPRSYRRWCRDPQSVSPPRGESVGEMMTRVGAVVERLRRRRRRGTLVIVTPAMVRRGVEALLTGVRWEALRSRKSSTGAWTDIEV